MALGLAPLGQIPRGSLLRMADRPTILARIQKLNAIASRDTTPHHEAVAAKRQAQRMTSRHGVTAAELQPPQGRGGSFEDIAPSTAPAEDFLNLLNGLLNPR